MKMTFKEARDQMGDAACEFMAEITNQFHIDDLMEWLEKQLERWFKWT